MEDMVNFKKAKRLLREYYNEVVDILDQLDEEEITYDEPERALQLLDHKYAIKITEIT